MGQPKIPATPAGTSLAGKTAVITGGNTGMGYEAARQYLLLGASRVILAVRSTVKGEAAVASLRADLAVQKTNPSAVVECFALDLDDLESVVAVARRIREQVGMLDILLLNGGVNILRCERSRSGHERVMQVNAYSNFILALELLPLLRQTALKRGEPSHLTIVGSVMLRQHSLASMSFGGADSVMRHFDDEKQYQRLARYSDSKLAVYAFVRALAGKVPSGQVVINTPCPGLVATGFDKNLPVWLKPLMAVYRKLAARTVEEGSRTLIYASVVAGAESHGKFLTSNQVEEGLPYLNTPDGQIFADKLWAETLVEAKTYSAIVETF